MPDPVSLLGYALAALFAGLWWGERGRRKDAQTREGVIPQAKPRAVGRDPSMPTDDPSQPAGAVRDAAFEQMVADTMQETGCSRQDAEREVENMLRQINTLGSGSVEW